MTAMARREAALLLLSLDPPAWFLRHSCAVADVAAWLAVHAAAHGRIVDTGLIAVAGLLHDVDKLPSAGVPAHLRHGDGSAAWLADMGWPELGPVVRDHPVTRLADDAYETWAADASLEARIVAYADKRAGQRLESMEQRFASWRRRYPAGPLDAIRGPSTTMGPAAVAPATERASGGSGWSDGLAALVVDRARALERDVCGAAGVRPGDVRRLRWSRRALREVTS
jgi:hypothetical protein